MGKAGRRHCLVLEPFEEALIAGQMGMEDLDGDGAGQDLVVAFPDRRHAALGHQPYQAITAAEPAIRVGGGAGAPGTATEPQATRPPGGL